MHKKLRVLLLLIAFSLVVAILSSGIVQWVSVDKIINHYGELEGFVELNKWLSFALYFIAMTLLITLCLPGGGILCISAGMLFGWAQALLLSSIAATLGALIAFKLIAYIHNDYLYQKFGKTALKIKDGFHSNVWSTMFVLRSVPVFPFGAVTLAASMLRVPLRVFVMTTLLGSMIPMAMLTFFGGELNQLLALGESFDVSDALYNPKFLLPLTMLTGLALLPVIVKKVSSKKTQN